MVLSPVLLRPPRLVLAALAAASLLLAAGPASAQQFDYNGYLPPNNAAHAAVVVYPKLMSPKSRGSVLPLYWYVPTGPDLEWRTAPAAYEVVLAPVAPPPLIVTVSTPPEPKPLYVDIRGPEGQVRSFAVAGGAATIHTRDIVVRAGETATIRLAVGPTR